MPDVDIELLRSVLEAKTSQYGDNEYEDGQVQAYDMVLDWLSSPDALRDEASRLGLCLDHVPDATKMIEEEAPCDETS